MGWPKSAQRVLIVLAAALLAFAVVRGRNDARRPAFVSVPDDSTLDVHLDLNTASVADLESLPGVGAALAGRIDGYRATRGPFTAVDELRQVPGVGAKLVETLRPLVTIR